jgi:hypothetical protein
LAESGVAGGDAVTIDPNDESVGVDSDTQASSMAAPTAEAKSKTPSACNSRTDSFIQFREPRRDGQPFKTRERAE